MKGFTVQIVIAVVIIGILFGFASCKIVKPGYRGILITGGHMSEDIKEPGMHFRFPILQRIISMPILIQSATFDNLSAASNSMQDVFTDVQINYHIDPTRVCEYYNKFKSDPEAIMKSTIAAKLKEAVKTSTPRYSTEQLLQQRTAVRDSIYISISKVAAKYGVIVDEFSMTNFRFSPGYQASIEEKQILEQKTISAARKNDVAELEGKAKVISAKAEAEANRLRQAAITDELIRYEAVQKWDGKLPQVTGGNIPFINIK